MPPNKVEGARQAPGAYAIVPGEFDRGLQPELRFSVRVMNMDVRPLLGEKRLGSPRYAAPSWYRAELPSGLLTPDTSGASPAGRPFQQESVLLTDPETDFARGLFKICETLRTGRGTLTWEAVGLLIDTGLPFYGSIGWSGTVDIAGRNALCDPAAETYCVPFAEDPTAGERQDFNFIIRGVRP